MFLDLLMTSFQSMTRMNFEIIQGYISSRNGAQIGNQLNTESSYLDLDLKVENRIFNSRLYDKRDAFHFSVVCMPYKWK